MFVVRYRASPAVSTNINDLKNNYCTKYKQMNYRMVPGWARRLDSLNSVENSAMWSFYLFSFVVLFVCLFVLSCFF